MFEQASSGRNWKKSRDGVLFHDDSQFGENCWCRGIERRPKSENCRYHNGICLCGSSLGGKGIERFAGEEELYQKLVWVFEDGGDVANDWRLFVWDPEKDEAVGDKWVWMRVYRDDSEAAKRQICWQTLCVTRRRGWRPGWHPSCKLAKVYLP